MSKSRSNPLRISLLLLVLLASGCATVPERITCDQMPPRTQREGFSYAKPTSSRWFLLKSEDHPDDVTLRWDLHSPAHTFFLHVGYGDLERQPVSHEDFARLVKPRGASAGEGKELTRGEAEVTIDGHWCVRIDSVDVVHPKDLIPELHLARHGYRCVHPSFPRRTLDWSYTEEGLPSEFSTILEKDAEAFLAGVRIERVASAGPALQDGEANSKPDAATTDEPGPATAAAAK